MLKKLADNTNRNSVAASLRRRRHALLLQLMSGLPRPVSILDVGGTENYWATMDMTAPEEYHITILNIQPAVQAGMSIRNVVGDARRMEFGEGEFDVVFSNSVIEHVGGLEDQARMAAEVRRVGKRYFVQTPNRNFPIEPHFLVPFYQFMPVSLRVYLLGSFRLGWFPRTTDAAKAREIVESIRLMNKRELAGLFPGAQIHEERILGMVKSFMVYDGWADDPTRPSDTGKAK